MCKFNFKLKECYVQLWSLHSRYVRLQKHPGIPLFILYKVGPLNGHLFSFKILYEQPGYGQNMSQYGIYISIYKKGRLLCSHNLLYLKYILMLSYKWNAITCAIDSGGSESLSSEIVSLARVDSLITFIHIGQMQCDKTKVTGHLETRTCKNKS